MGYTPKDLAFGQAGRKKLMAGITKIATAVKSTLGPMGNTVLLESPNHLRGITVTKDGVTVARSIELMDPVENMAVRVMKEASERTATEAGDGTTTAIVIAEAMVQSGDRYITDDVNKTEVLRHLSSMADGVCRDLQKASKKLTKKRLRDVATISSNNDPKTGQYIFDAYNKVGPDGVVTVENSKTTETYVEVTNGIKFDRGYSTHLFINNHKKDECILDDVHVLVSDAEITNIMSIENVLKPIINEGKKLLVIAPCSVNVRNTFAANVAKNNLKLCTVDPPSFGFRRHELMSDIALAVGATYFSEDTGDDLSLMTFADLGHAARVVVSRDSTVIVKEDSDSEELKKRIEEIRVQHDGTDEKGYRKFLMERIASLSGGIGVIYVGGNTDLEQKEHYDRVDDAVCAVRAALDGGILPGGGVALNDVGMSMTDNSYDTKEEAVAALILVSGMKAPINQIHMNAGLEDAESDEGIGLNVKTGEVGDMIDMGIIDPAKVTKSALTNAVSVACTILSTDAIVTMARSYETSE